MSRLLRCNRCGQEHETPMPVPNLQGFTAPVKAEGWAVMTLGPGPLPARYDLCEDCAEVLVEQFMVGAAVAPITQPAAQVVLSHDPMTDCQLVWNPGKGAFLCYHDDPELYHALIIDNAQNVAEGVPEQVATTTEGVPTIRDGADKKRQDMDAQLRDRIGQLAGDMHTAGWAHSIQQTCSAACSEQHTYGEHCILEGVVQVKNFTADQLTRAGADSCGEEHTYLSTCALRNVNVPGQIMPPACGAECDPKMGNHTNVPGTCMNNPDTSRAIAVVCPVCKSEGSLAGITSHMAEHGYQPDYANHQWVDGRGYNLDGRLISQQGEDLTEAYSEQEAAE